MSKRSVLVFVGLCLSLPLLVGACAKNEDSGQPEGPAVDARGFFGISGGTVAATITSGDKCEWTLDGVVRGTSSFMTSPLAAGNHSVSCKRADGEIVKNATVAITDGKTTNVYLSFTTPMANQPPPPAGDPSKGTVVAVAVGGSCTWAINGASKGTSSQLKLAVPAGTYSVSCKPASGAQKTRSVIIKPGEMAMAMFKLA